MSGTLPYKNPNLRIEERVTDLLARMERDEKIGQLGQFFKKAFDDKPGKLVEGLRAGRWGSRILAESAWAGNNAESALNVDELNELQRIAVEESRLGIPLIYGRDVIYGHRTVFPIPHSYAASFNPKLVEDAMTVVAREAAAEGVHWTFSPMIDLVRDPRWGRVIESCGEDPLLLAEMGKAAIRGFQGDDPANPERLLACMKHFAGYGAAEGGRDYATTEWSEDTLHNQVLPPFKAAVEAGVATAMAGFNDLGGTPVSSSRALMREWLKEQLEWDGFIVSDWGSIFDLIGHGVAIDKREAARKGFEAGIDLEMTADFYESQLGSLIEDGVIDESLLDDAVARILRAKFRAGLFEHPYTDTSLRDQVMRRPGHVELAEQLAAQSIVLLKNEHNALPLRGDLKRVAVLGPYAEARREHLGSWCLDGRPSEVTTILEGLRAESKSIEFLTTNPAFSDAMLSTARNADVIILCLGESHLRNGENKSIAELRLPPGQEELIIAMAEFGKPVIVVDCSGRYMPIPAAAAYAKAIVHAGHLGTEAGTAIARVLLGKANPSGKLPMSVPRCTGQIPIHYNRKIVGKAVSFLDRYRGYEDTLRTPLYPFGYGLSYTQFAIEDVQLSQSAFVKGETVTVSATVRNIGDRVGAEVVQLYARDDVASTTPAERELKAFKRVELEPGESKEITFDLTADTFAFHTANKRWDAEPGTFHLGLGTDSSCPMDLVLELV